MTTELPVETTKGFHAMNLSSHLLAALERVGYFQPTPIQAALIPPVLQGRDVIGQAQTGTGKTASYLLPFLHHWRSSEDLGPQALVLAPTRELVAQVAEESKKLAPSKTCRTAAIYGGQGLRQQVMTLKKGCAVVVGSPGRVLDHLGRGTLALDQVRYVVLDEADRMLDIGFRPDIERILRRCPKVRQTLLLSATLPPPVLRLAQRYLNDPLHINLSPDRVAVSSIRQTFITVEEEKKFDLLLKVFEREQPRQCIIFCERKRWADEVYRDLRREHKKVAVMHGDLEQDQREKIMKGFREGKVAYLVATDVVGRGIDVNDISHIINYDLPMDPENYVHRIGRTGRMGKNGIAIAFVTPEQGPQLTAIEHYINQELSEDRIPGFIAYTPRKRVVPEAPKVAAPVFGRRTKRYSNRL